METINKGKSPFYPGQPVPTDFFVGRRKEIERIVRAVQQVEMGKPQAVFLTGEYGIGKSSLAGFLRFYAEKNHHLLGVHVLLGGAETLEDVAVKTVEAVLKQPFYREGWADRIRNLLGRYLGQQSLFGVNINFEVLKKDSPNISHGFLPFLRDLLNRVKEDGVNGLMLIFDEVNGITQNKQFSHFIKSLVDENALSPNPLPLMLMLCGVEERRRQMILHHQPVERIFDVVEIDRMDKSEMRDFFHKTFQSAGMIVQEEAMEILTYYSAGFPKLMHIIGDNVFWKNQDATVDYDDAVNGTISAAEEVGSKFVDQQVLKALRSSDYHSILKKLSRADFDLSFFKRDIEKGLSESEKKKFHNFLQRMKKLGLFRPGETRGEYVFTNRLARLYIRLKFLKK